MNIIRLFVMESLTIHVCNIEGCQPEDERGDGPRDVDGEAHGEGRVLQELRRQAGLDVRVCHRGQPEIQGGESDP